MERSLAFYRKLGFDVEHDFVPPGQSSASWAWLDGGGGMIMLHRAEEALPESGARTVSTLIAPTSPRRTPSCDSSGSRAGR